MRYIMLFLFVICFISTANAQKWVTVKTFSGSGIKNTAPFTVNDSEWKISYRSTASDPVMDGAGHMLMLTLVEVGQESWQGQMIANQVNKIDIKGESYIYKSGRFYLESSSANGDWKIEIQVKEK